MGKKEEGMEEMGGCLTKGWVLFNPTVNKNMKLLTYRVVNLLREPRSLSLFLHHQNVFLANLPVQSMLAFGYLCVRNCTNSTTWLSLTITYLS